MKYTNMYSNIKVYQKYPVTSIKVGCATRSLYASSGPKAEVTVPPWGPGELSREYVLRIPMRVVKCE